MNRKNVPTASEQADIAERKQAMNALSKSEIRLQHIIDCTSDWIWEVDAHGIYTFCSGRIHQVLGYEPEEVMGRTPFDLMPPEEADRIGEIFSGIAVRKAPIVNLENWNLAKDGRRVCLLTNGVPIVSQEGQLLGYRGADQDITERKRMEEALCSLNDELEQKVEEKTNQLIKTQNELVRKEKLAILGQLAGTMGHELRNPLGVMNNAIYFLKSILPDAEDIVLEYLDIIKKEIENALQIISDLLDFSRTKPPKKAAVSIDAWVHQSLDRCKVPKNITVNVSVPEGLPLLNIDLFQMTQVLQNLITNGVQAMPGGGMLEIAAGLDKSLETPATTPAVQARECIKINVRDTGTGIPPENMKNLFQPLFTTKPKGVGLGLVVCKNLVEANGGEISAESRLSEGTTFTVALQLPKEKK